MGLVLALPEFYYREFRTRKHIHKLRLLLKIISNSKIALFSSFLICEELRRKDGTNICDCGESLGTLESSKLVKNTLKAFEHLKRILETLRRENIDANIVTFIVHSDYKVPQWYSYGFIEHYAKFLETLLPDMLSKELGIQPENIDIVFEIHPGFPNPECYNIMFIDYEKLSSSKCYDAGRDKMVEVLARAIARLNDACKNTSLNCIFTIENRTRSPKTILERAIVQRDNYEDKTLCKVARFGGPPKPQALITFYDVLDIVKDLRAKLPGTLSQRIFATLDLPQHIHGYLIRNQLLFRKDLNEEDILNITSNEVCNLKSKLVQDLQEYVLSVHVHKLHPETKNMHYMLDEETKNIYETLLDALKAVNRNIYVVPEILRDPKTHKYIQNVGIKLDQLIMVARLVYGS